MLLVKLQFMLMPVLSCRWHPPRPSSSDMEHRDKLMRRQFFWYITVAAARRESAVVAVLLSDVLTRMSCHLQHIQYIHMSKG